MLKRNLLLLLSFILLVGSDQLTKEIAKEHLVMGEQLSYLGDFFRLTLIENHGSFLGLGSSLPEEWRFLIFTMVSSIILIILISMAFFSKSSIVQVAAIVLVASGGIGNVIDRVLNNGGVVDFLNFGLGSIRTGIFNIADVYIMVGGFILIFSFWIEKHLIKSESKN